jgi:phage protein D
MKLLLPLAHYHTIYLIVKLTQINLMFIRLEDCSTSIGPSLTPLQLLHEFQTSLLFTKH